MKKQLIGTLVGAIILFIWQFISWGAINFHKAETQYTPNQDKILAVLSENLTEGQYFVPGVPLGSSSEEEMAIREQAMGKPWATINYHPEMKMSMPMNMTRGFVIDFISAFFLCWILLKFGNLNFMDALIASVMVGLIGYFTITYLNHVWFENSTIGYLIDAIGSWALVGAWLGWFLPRGSS
ncbi:MAG: hypothetical protein ACI8P3_002174 [Saprospiraceae bacterium]|jgi:hypothetical protein